MYPVLAALVVLAGWTITGVTRGTANGIERLGLSILFGLGALSVLMLLPHLAGLPIAPVVYLPLFAILAAASFRRIRRGKGDGTVSDRPGIGRLRVAPGLLHFHEPLAAIGIGLLLLAFLVLIVLRCLYLPNVTFDSLTGFDLLGKIIAAERTFRVSLFEYGGIARRGTYPPFTALTLAWGYQSGLQSSMTMMILPLIGFLLWLFGFARRFMGATAALCLLVLPLLGSDFYAWCHQPSSNFPSAIFGGPALLYVFAGVKERNRAPLIAASVAAALAAWCRPDAWVFAAGGAVALLLAGRARGGGWRRALVHLAPAVVVFGAWQLYAGLVLGEAGTSRIVTSLVWDPERVSVLLSEGTRLLFLPASMGYAAFFLGAAIAGWTLRRRLEIGALLAAIVVTLGLYWGMYYVLDPARQDPLAGLMQTSYRRGLIAFVLPFWFAWLVSPPGEWVRRAAGRLFAGSAGGEHDQDDRAERHPVPGERNE